VRVNVRIDRLVLDGLELSRRERDLLVSAIERELRPLADGGAAGPAADAAVGGRPPGSRVVTIATHVAAAVNGAMPPNRRAGSPRR
jgi:hypothetical protein